MKKNASIIGVIGLLVLVVFVSGCTSNNNSPNQSDETVRMQIISNSSWNGTLTYNNTDFNISGIKNRNYNLGSNPGAVTIYLQKNNNVEGNLTVRLLQGKKTIELQSTSSKNGIINISHNF